MGRLALPRNLVAAAEHEGRQEWLASTLPAVIAVVQELWSLTVGEPFQPGGQTAWVALHAGNVLGAAREPWLVIDPKPYIGDPAYDPLQELDRRP